MFDFFLLQKLQIKFKKIIIYIIVFSDVKINYEFHQLDLCMLFLELIKVLFESLMMFRYVYSKK